MSINEVLLRQAGKTITHINNYNDIGVFEIWLSDESCIHIAGNGSANSNGEPEVSIAIVEPQEPKITEIK